MPGIHIEFSRNSTPFGQAVTDGTGTYSIQLPPGTYQVSLKSLDGRVKSDQVTVAAGQVTNRDFVIDSGIR
jgi:hypothetical protein